MGNDSQASRGSETATAWIRSRPVLAVALGGLACLLVLAVARQELSGPRNRAPRQATAGVVAGLPPSSERPDPCTSARELVEGAGLHLPGRFEFRCPADVKALGGAGHGWGLSCADTAACPRQPYVAVDASAMGDNDARLRYVVAHEFCHAIEYEAGRSSSEEAADSCAAAHGFPPV